MRAEAISGGVATDRESLLAWWTGLATEQWSGRRVAADANADWRKHTTQRCRPAG